MEIVQVQPQMDEGGEGTSIRNAKKISIGNGRFDIDSTAMRLRNPNGNIDVYIGEDE